MVGTNRRTMAPPSPGAPALCKDKAGLGDTVRSHPCLVPSGQGRLDSRYRPVSPAVSQPLPILRQRLGRSGPDAMRITTHHGSEMPYTGAYPHSRPPDVVRPRFCGPPGPTPTSRTRRPVRHLAPAVDALGRLLAEWSCLAVTRMSCCNSGPANALHAGAVGLAGHVKTAGFAVGGDGDGLTRLGRAVAIEAELVGASRTAGAALRGARRANTVAAHQVPGASVGAVARAANTGRREADVAGAGRAIGAIDGAAATTTDADRWLTGAAYTSGSAEACTRAALVSARAGRTVRQGASADSLAEGAVERGLDLVARGRGQGVGAGRHRGGRDRRPGKRCRVDAQVMHLALAGVARAVVDP